MATDNDDKDQLDPLDAMLAFEPGPLPPVAPDGGFAPQIAGPMEPIPDATIGNMLCFRNCKHFVQITVPFPHGNAKGTFQRIPVLFTRYCTITPSPIDLTDEVVFDCTHWDPTSPADLDAVGKRRDDWYAAHPDVKPPGNLTAIPLIKEGN
jgi:hypothetical protein